MTQDSGTPAMAHESIGSQLNLCLATDGGSTPLSHIFWWDSLPKRKPATQCIFGLATMFSVRLAGRLQVLHY